MSQDQFSKPQQTYSYKLLLTRESMQRLGQVPDAAKREVSNALHELASGDWEMWGKKSGFTSWREDEDHGMLFSLSITGFGVLLWQRAWSIDLLGSIAYPSGAYYDQPPQANRYSPHVVLRGIPPMERVAGFRLQFDGRLYKEEPGLERSDSWKSVSPQDEIAYEEELYLLSPNVMNDVLNGKQEGLPLHLSEEQIKVLGVPGPSLLSGEAGSGKTSVITQWLVINHLRHQEKTPRPSEPIRQLFVTLSGRLRDHTSQEFTTMLPKTAHDHRTSFRTYRELLLGILELAGERGRFPPANEMTFEKFMQEYAPRLKKGQVDPVLLWDEIRSVIKGGALGKSDVLLDFARYEKLSEERGQCKTPSNLREVYYDAAQNYQASLIRNALWDGIDLARACIGLTESAEKYEKIACDEVQDLAPVEIKPLLGLLDGQVSDIFFTGDTAQVINPSGFQWARLKLMLYEDSRGLRIPEVNYLKRNYRSCREIVELVNGVLLVRSELLDDEVSHHEQEPLLPVRVKPMVLRDSPLERMKSLVSNPNVRLVLTKTSNEKAKLMALLGQARDYVTVLTIEEAKGLEYDGVLLWNFFIPRHEAITKSDWERVFTPEKRRRLKESIQGAGINPYGLTYEFNLLHVGLTRARRLLFIFDEDPVMRIANLGEQVASTLTQADIGDFEVHWKTESPTPEDLHALGSRLIDHDRGQAVRMFMLAAEAAERGGQLVQAAESYEAAGAFERSAHCYKAVDDRANELEMLALYQKSQGRPGEAAKLFEERGTLLSRGRDLSEAFESFEAAIPLYSEVGHYISAAGCALLSAEAVPPTKSRERALKFQEAADLLVKGGDHDRAIRTLERAIQEAQNARQAGKSVLPGEPNEDWIARLYKDISSHEGAKKRYAESARAARKAAGLWLSLTEDPNYASRRGLYEAQSCESLATSIQSYIKAGETTQASALQEDLLKRFKGGVLETRDVWNQFAVLYFEAGELDQYAETFLQLSSYLVGRREYREALDQLDLAIKKCEEPRASRLVLKLLHERVKVTNTAKDPAGIGDSYEQLANAYQDAGEPLKAFENFHSAAIGYLDARDEDKAEQLLERAYRLASSAMAPIEIGWYCYKEVASDEYAARRMFSEASTWIDRACVHFTQDSERSIKRIEAHWNEQQNEVTRLVDQMKLVESGERQQKLEERRQTESRSLALIELVLAKLYDDVSRTKGESAKQTAQTWRKRAEASLVLAHDQDALAELGLGNHA